MVNVSILQNADQFRKNLVT